MKGSEHKEIETLGKLQAALSVLERAAPNGPAKVYWKEAVKYTRKAMLAQWEMTTQYIHDDDT